MSTPQQLKNKLKAKKQAKDSKNPTDKLISKVVFIGIRVFIFTVYTGFVVLGAIFFFGIVFGEDSDNPPKFESESLDSAQAETIAV